MITKLFRAFFVLGAVAFNLPANLLAADAPPRPNIIVILCDDMGFSDIGCFGSEIPTPNLDTLAATGLRFTQFYNTGRCCPSRAALLTGLYSHEAGIGHMTEDDHLPGYRGRLNDNCMTMAEVLDGAGYFTAMAGKWHVGQEHGVVPWKRGFRRSINSPAGGFYYPEGKKHRIYLDGKPLDDDAPELPKNWYTTDLWTDYAIKFIDEGRATKKPVFLYLAYNAPHFPLQAPTDEIAQFRGKYKMGWDKLREQRNAKQKQLGLVDPSWELTPRPEDVKAWDSLSDKEKDRFDEIMAIYAACVAHVDKDIGRLVEALKERGMYDNTLIVFMSDNGGNGESGPDGILKGDNPGGPYSTVFCGKSWATLENTPFRRYKHFNHEGGVASPFIAHWPAGFSGQNEFRQTPAHLIDIMATCVDVSGAIYPTEYNGHSIIPMEGRSLAPAFNNKPIQRDALFWEHEGNAAVRVGDWKLVRAGRRNPWELYDMKKDRSEMHDLSAQYPDRAKELLDKWQAWADRTHVRPFPKSEKKKKKPAQQNAQAAPAPDEQ